MFPPNPGVIGPCLGASVVGMTGEAPGIEWVGAWVAAQPPTVPRMALTQRMIQPQKSTVPRHHLDQ